MVRWLVVVVIATGCKGKTETATGTGTGTGTGAGTGTGTGTGAGAGAAAGMAAAAAAAAAGSGAGDLTDVKAKATRCAYPCLYLTDMPLDQAKAAHGRDCATEWPYVDDDCDGLLYARNCIYAGYGYTFKRTEWKSNFEHTPWYRARATFSEKDFPALVSDNIHALKVADEACRKPIPAVSDADRALVKATYDTLHTDPPTAIPGVFDDTEGFGIEFRNLYIQDKTTMTYAAAPKDGQRTIYIETFFWAVGPGNYEDTHRLGLTFDAKDQLVEVKFNGW
jgi:hypothetical protein